MSRKASSICLAVLCCLLLAASALALYKTEEHRLELVSKNQSYITCAQETQALAKSLGVTTEAYSAESSVEKNDEQIDNLHRMASELRWLAEYNTDSGRLERAAAKLSTSESVKTLSGGATYEQMSLAALSYHQSELESANSSATAKSIACIAVFVLSLAGLAYNIVRLELSNQQDGSICP